MKQHLLIEKYNELRGRKFNWQQHNCGLAAADLVSSYSGVDYGRTFRKYCTGPLAAYRVLRRYGGFYGIMKELGFEEIQVTMAQRGDPVLYVWKEGRKRREALGVVMDHRAAFAGENGFDMIDVIKCHRAWRVS